MFSENLYRYKSVHPKSAETELVIMLCYLELVNSVAVRGGIIQSGANNTRH